MSLTKHPAGAVNSGFSAIGEAYRANARLNVSSPRFIARIGAWIPGNSLLWRGTSRPLLIARSLYRLYGPKGVLTSLLVPDLAWFRPCFHRWGTSIPEKVSAWLGAYDETSDPMAASRLAFPKTTSEPVAV